jgi:hypothetical protein
MPQSRAHSSASICPALAAQLTIISLKILSNLRMLVDIHCCTDYPAFSIIHYTQLQKKAQQVPLLSTNPLPQ